MLTEISNTVRDHLIAAGKDKLVAASSICFTTAGLWAGRKVCLGLLYNAGCLAAKALDKPIASEWKKTSQEYFREANKTKTTDFTIVSLVAAGIIMGHAGNSISHMKQFEAHKKVLVIESFKDLLTVMVTVIGTASGVVA
jgi:hypothetical protein